MPGIELGGSALKNMYVVFIGTTTIFRGNSPLNGALRACLKQGEYSQRNEAY